MDEDEDGWGALGAPPPLTGTALDDIGWGTSPPRRAPFDHPGGLFKADENGEVYLDLSTPAACALFALSLLVPLLGLVLGIAGIIVGATLP